MTPRLFLDRVLNGAAVGIVVGLIPNAITGELFTFLAGTFPTIDLFTTLHQVVVGIQFTVPVIVGILIGMQFGMTSVQTVIIGTAVLLHWLLAHRLHVYSPQIFAFAAQGAPATTGAADKDLDSNRPEATDDTRSQDPRSEAPRSDSGPAAAPEAEQTPQREVATATR